MMKTTLLYSIIVLSSCTDPAVQTRSGGMDTAIVDTPVVQASPAQTLIKGGSEVLYMYKWSLQELDGKPIAADSPERIPQLAFFPGQVNRVTGTTGCNKITGTFDIGGDNLFKFQPLATTKMACTGENIEAPFLKALSDVDQFSVGENDTLLLLKAGATILKFSGKPGDAAPAK